MAGGKSLDGKVLVALHLLSIRETGVRYMDFVKLGIMNGALELLDRGYATRARVGEDGAIYYLTPKGREYLEKILRFATEQF